MAIKIKLMLRNLFYILFEIILPWTAIFFHLYIVYIAFKEGLLSGILTLILPVIAEIYWLIKLWDVNSTIKTLFFVILIGSLIRPLFVQK